MPSAGAAVAWGPDGATLATPCDDSKIYLWDAATGGRKAVLAGATNAGLYAAIHPSGTLLASNGWENRLRLWDPILGRTVLSLTTSGFSGSEFSRDGRIVAIHDDAVSTYEVEPALEYRTFAHAFVEPSIYWRASIRHDGRVLALGTDRGVALWDLARGTELPFLPIGQSLCVLFEASDDLLIVSSSRPGVYRWPIRLDPERGEFRIGPPRRLRLPPGSGDVAEDRAGRTVAVPCHEFALVSTPERMVRVEPLDNVRSVAVSPDGQWLATGSHHRGAQVWRIRDAMKVAEPPVDSRTSVTFSPDGKWWMTGASPCRLWAVGNWNECFGSVATGSASRPTAAICWSWIRKRVIHLVEAETGRVVARFESPDSCAVKGATFTPDGSRLAVVTDEGPAVHVWDLRAIRKRLAVRDLDWDAPPYPAADPADPSAPPLPPLQIELDPLDGHVEQYRQSPEELIAFHTERIGNYPESAEPPHLRGHALVRLNRFPEGSTTSTERSA